MRQIGRNWVGAYYEDENGDVFYEYEIEYDENEEPEEPRQIEPEEPFFP